MILSVMVALEEQVAGRKHKLRQGPPEVSLKAFLNSKIKTLYLLQTNYPAKEAPIATLATRLQTLCSTTILEVTQASSKRT